MGKVLETLNQMEVKRGGETRASQNLRPFQPEPEEGGEMDQDDIPFIEVGGPRPIGVTPRGGHQGASEPPRETEAVVSTPRFQPLVHHAAALQSPHVKLSFRPMPEAAPPARLAPELIVYHLPDHPISRQYHLLKSSLVAHQPAAPAQVLLFTAATPDIGTTTVLLNLALTFAQRDAVRVVVVDANWERPAVAQRLGLAAAPGLYEILTWKATLEQALRETPQPNLSALPAGEPIPETDGRFLAEALRCVIRHLRERFDLILLDAPCWHDQPELLALSTVCDAVYLVLRPADADCPPILDLQRQLPQRGVPLKGLVLTQK
ncbi:MAG: CpsD/CapB family tyrosine-protein kinase [Gemmataceae bacterium]